MDGDAPERFGRLGDAKMVVNILKTRQSRQNKGKSQDFKVLKYIFNSLLKSAHSRLRVGVGDIKPSLCLGVYKAMVA